MSIACIDADILVYRSGFACERKKYLLNVGGTAVPFDYKRDLTAYVAEQELEEDGYTVEVEKNVEPVSHAIHILDNYMKAIMKALDTKKYVAYLSHSTIYRDKVAKTVGYKANRADVPRPVHYQALKERLRERWDAVDEEGLEADDLLGIAVTSDPDAVLCSIDKDLDMIVGRHYNFVTDEHYFIDEDTAAWCFAKQLLTGDATDNIIGLKGVGPKTAEKLLANAEKEDWPKLIGDLYNEQFGDDGPARLRENTLLLWICSCEEDVQRLADAAKGEESETAN